MAKLKVTVSLDAQLLTQVDVLAKQGYLSRSSQIEAMLRAQVPITREQYRGVVASDVQRIRNMILSKPELLKEIAQVLAKHWSA